MEKFVKLCSISPLFFLLINGVLPIAFAGHDYGQALSKGILFFEAQRSGYLPRNQRVQWRGNSGLSDGKASGVDLVGGYYDAGDNVKFGLPMAFTITTMSWSIIEYGKQMAAAGELSHALDAVKWGTDYLIKAHVEPNVLYGEVNYFNRQEGEPIFLDGSPKEDTLIDSVNNRNKFECRMKNVWGGKSFIDALMESQDEEPFYVGSNDEGDDLDGAGKGVGNC